MGEIKQIPNSPQNEEPIDEYEIIALAKRLNITLNDMKEMSFVSLINILLSNMDSETFENTKEATQDDINKYFG